jgi:hypothetical protein
MNLRWTIATVLALGLFASLGAAGASGSSGPTCFGKSGTITGSGSIEGTAGNDVIVGSDAADAIDGKGGNDLICGLGGDDVVSGGLGNDKLDGGAGNDQVVGDIRSVSEDVVGGGSDLLLGGDGNDSPVGDSWSLFGTAEGAQSATAASLAGGTAVWRRPASATEGRISAVTRSQRGSSVAGAGSRPCS